MSKRIVRRGSRGAPLKVFVLGSGTGFGAVVLDGLTRSGIDANGLDVAPEDLLKIPSILGDILEMDWVVNCLGYEDIDGAEAEREKAFALNAEGVRLLARTCRQKFFRMVQFSSDHIFDGLKRGPYNEKDQPRPVNIYGASKLLGEKAVRAEGGKYLIVRTQTLFGFPGDCVERLARRLKEPGAPLRVAQDRITAPTYAGHLVEALAKLLLDRRHGLVNVSSAHECSWHEFAQGVASRIGARRGIEPALCRELGLAAQRPFYTVLCNRRFRVWTGYLLRPWKEGLDEFLKGPGSALAGTSCIAVAGGGRVEKPGTSDPH